MPIYEYRCAECGVEHEINQKMSDDPLETCPSCGKNGLERLVSASSFALKGGGWYADGYGPGSKKSTGTSESSSSSSKSDAKPDKKPESKPDKKSDSSS